jgi:hypothetical protein
LRIASDLDTATRRPDSPSLYAPLFLTSDVTALHIQRLCRGLTKIVTTLLISGISSPYETSP